MRRIWRLYGTIFVPSENLEGRPREISKLLEHELLGYLEQRPMAYLDEKAYFLLDEYDVAVDEATIWRCLGTPGL